MAEFAAHVEFGKRIKVRGEGGKEGRWVTPISLEPDGRLRVKEEGGGEELLVSDYLL